MNDINNCVIYARVSTKEQVKGFSIDNQIEECKRFALSENYNIKKIFVDSGESAKTTNRTEYKKMFKFVTNSANNISAVIIWKMNRFSRDTKDSLVEAERLAYKRIKLLSATERNDDTPEGKLYRTINSAFNEYENSIRRETIIAGMKKGFHDGYWHFYPPIGYKYKENEDDKKQLYPTDESEIVIEAFYLASKGIYTQVEIRNRLKVKFGKKIHRQTLNRMLRNHLYYGYIYKPNWHPEPIKGKHEAIITKEIFNKVQRILDGKERVIKARNRNNPEFPLRRTVRCYKCGRYLTAYFAKGKYPRYSCKNPDCTGTISREDIRNSFIALLKSMQLRTEFSSLAKAVITDTLNSYYEKQKENISNLRTRITKLKKKLESIESKYIDGKFDDETYNKWKSNIRSETSELEYEITNSNISISEINKKIDFAFSFLSNLPEIWLKCSDINTRQRIQSLLFPDGVIYENGISRTSVTLPIFNYLPQPLTQDVVYGGGGGSRTRVQGFGCKKFYIFITS